jgi:RNA polymerase sigma factor (sigma-70 family)
LLPRNTRDDSGLVHGRGGRSGTKAFFRGGHATSRRCIFAGALAFRNSHDAEDVVQEACLRAFRAIGTFSSGNGRAWLLAIVRNTALTHLARSRHTPIVATDDFTEIETTTDDPDQVSPEAA